MIRTFAVLLLLVPVDVRAEDWDVVVEDSDSETTAKNAKSDSTNDALGDLGGERESESSSDADFSILDADHLSWSGYFENQLAVFRLPRERTAPDSSGWDLMDYNRLRIDLSARPARGFRLDADVIVRTFHGTTRYDLRDMLAPRFDSELDLLASIDPSLVRFDLDHEIFLDNAFFTADAGPFRLRVGKQQIRFGSGYLWNPTDPFNTKDLLDPTYELPGITAVRMQLFLPHEGLLEAYLLPRDLLDDFHAEDTSAALRARIAFDRWVVAVTYAYLLDIVGVDPATVTPAGARRNLIGLEVTGEVAGIGIWAEGAFNLTDRRPSSLGFEPFGDPTCVDGVDRLCWFEALAGANYTFEGGVIVQAEYLYNGRGDVNSGQYALADWYAYLEQRVRYLGSHYVTGMVQVPIEELHLTLTAMAIANLSDGSALLTPWVQWDWSQYLALTLYGGFNVSGDDTDEFRTVGQAAYLRFRFSF